MERDILATHGSFSLLCVRFCFHGLFHFNFRKIVNCKGFLKRPQKFEIFSNKQVGDFLAFSNCLFSFLVLPIKCLRSNPILEHWTFQEGVK